MIFSFEGFELDTPRREFRRGAALIALEPQIFDLLVYVIRNRDRVVSKDDLVEAVWSGRAISDSTLTSRINGMRKALGDSGEEQRLVRTVARKGIRFIAAVTERTEASAAPSATARLSAAPERPVLELPDKPSIAVLPFQNMSGDPEQEYFCDGMVEEITIALSRFQWLFVIARNSAMIYKDRATDLKQVARELGVRYVLEGSVRRAGQKVRITGQLIDAASGVHLWADTFDGDLTDMFELQDKVAVGVVSAIEPKLRASEVDRAKRKPTENLDAYDLYLRALPAIESLSEEGTLEALRILGLAIDKDPGYALAMAKAASCYSLRQNSGWITDLESESRRAVDLARAALALDKDDPEVLAYAAMAVARFGRDLDEGLILINRALSLNRNLADAWGYSAYLHNAAGKPSVGLQHGETSLRLAPNGRRYYFATGSVGIAHFLLGNLETAVEWLRRSAKEQPKYPSAHGFLVAALAHLGRMEEAREALRKRLELEPGLTLRVMQQRVTYRPEHAALYLDGLRKAGLPE